jgi:hypothetical protein
MSGVAPRLALATLALLGAVAPAAAASAPPRRLFTIGDSLAYDNRPYLQAELPHWQIQSDFSFARSARETARDLRADDRREPLPPVINVSSGTGDDPSRPGRFRRAVRRVMRLAGPQRCVVWANVYRPKLDQPTFDAINLVLAAEAARWPNLRVIDWSSMILAHRDWLVDLIHVNAEGNRARAAALAREVHACRRLLTAPLLPGPLPS